MIDFTHFAYLIYEFKYIDKHVIMGRVIKMKIEKIIERYKALGYQIQYFETGKEAEEYLNQILDQTTIGIGGSKSIDTLGIYDSLSKHNKVYWHWKDPSTRKEASQAKVYLTSANGMSINGEIVNIDGTGNRLASMLYGHDHLIIIAGINKMCGNLEEAIYRARNIAAPLNARRFNVDTPCVKAEMKCYDCNAKARICHGMVTLFKPMNGIQTTEVILINENLGY